jgi:LPS-assembly protein
MRYYRTLILTFFICVSLSLTANAARPDAYSPVDLRADKFIYEQADDRVIALGDVNVSQNGHTLKAQKVTYNIADDFAFAEGDVVMIDPSGDTHYAERIELSDQMRQGLVEQLYSQLEDGSRLWAKSGKMRADEEYVLKDARYTPCRACDNNPDATPTWALRASDVTHDKKSAMITYDDVRFEAWGVPIAYAPFFSHPDGSIEQKSGFLAPEIGFGSDFGFNFMVPYYYAINPSLDVTAGLRFFTRETPQLNTEIRKRYSDAMIQLQTSLAHSGRTETINDIEVERADEWRGHAKLDGLWNINRHWRAGSEIYLASDEQYLDEYDIDDEDILDNRLYIERFDDRDYASIELLAFQDLRTDINVDQPHALPFANMNFVGAPDSALGGRFQWNTSFLSLFREGNEQDVNRVSSRLYWQRRDILPLGLTSRVDLGVRGDSYYTSDRDIAKTDQTEDGSKADHRFVPTANLEIAYPLKKNLETAQIRVKPMVSITARPDIDNDSDIPNEDSQDAQIDAANLFEIDRFPGLDRVEDRSRINYGTHVGFYSHDGDELSGFIGQSYRLDDDDNPFQNGSGLENQESDFVGQINASFDDHRHNLNYRFQLDGQTFDVERHEAYAATHFYDTTLSGTYFFEKGSPGTEFTESREQLRATAKHQIDENWSVIGSALYDMGEDEGLRESQIGIGYDDDCFGITLVADRDLQSDSSGGDKTTIFARFRLKNLGEFETTAYSGSSSENGENDRE